MGLFSSSKPEKPKPTPQEEAAARIAKKRHLQYIDEYLPFEQQYIDYTKSLESPHVLRQNQLRAETPYLQRFNAQGVSPGALEPRLMQHQSELGLKRNVARQMAVTQHFNDYTKQFLDIVSLGRDLEISTDQARMSQARQQTQYQLAKREGDSIRQQGRYEAVGNVAGLATAFML